MTSSAESAGSDAVSVIIPAHNAEATLADCLDAVMAQQAPGLTLEVLVVDDRSTDGTRSVACRPGVRLLDGSGRGPAAARNLGARSASGSILVFLDADTRPKPGWLNELLTPLVDPEVAAVKGAYDSDQRGLLARFAQLEFEYKYARLERAQRVDFVDTGTAAFRRDAFERIGGFDERFPAHSAEDVELAFRLSEQGARFVFNQRARVRHAHPERLRDYLGKKLRYGFFRAQVYRRHPDKALGDSYTPPEMALQIGLAGMMLLLAPLAARSRLGRRGVVAALLAFVATTLPLQRRALWCDPWLAPCIPLLVLARSLAQGFGLAAGLAAIALGR